MGIEELEVEYAKIDKALLSWVKKRQEIYYNSLWILWFNENMPDFDKEMQMTFRSLMEVSWK